MLEYAVIAPTIRPNSTDKLSSFAFCVELVRSELISHDVFYCPDSLATWREQSFIQIEWHLLYYDIIVLSFK